MSDQRRGIPVKYEPIIADEEPSAAVEILRTRLIHAGEGHGMLPVGLVADFEQAVTVHARADERRRIAADVQSWLVGPAHAEVFEARTQAEVDLLGDLIQRFGSHHRVTEAVRLIVDSNPEPPSADDGP